MNTLRNAAVCALMLAALSVDTAEAWPLFSIDKPSPSAIPAGPFSPADILSPVPGGVAPMVVIPFAALGLQPFDDINAISYQMPLPDVAPSYLLSVDRFAVGIGPPGPGLHNVFSQAALGQAAGDVFFSNALGQNSLAINQQTLGLIPPVPAGVPILPPIDAVDALETNYPVNPGPVGLLFTLAPGSPSLPAIPATSADILTTPAPGAAPAVFMNSFQLGLVPGDAIDALMFVGVNPIISLAPGSPTLIAMGAGPGDLLVTQAGFAPAIFVPAGALGLAVGDNLTAIAAVPEPEIWAMMAIGMGLVGLRLRRGGRGRTAISSIRA